MAGFVAVGSQGCSRGRGRHARRAQLLRGLRLRVQWRFLQEEEEEEERNFDKMKMEQVPMVQKVQMIVEVPEIQIVENLVYKPVQKHSHIPMTQQVQEYVEVPQIQYIDKFVDVPVTKQKHVPMLHNMQETVEQPKETNLVLPAEEECLLLREVIAGLQQEVFDRPSEDELKASKMQAALSESNQSLSRAYEVLFYHLGERMNDPLVGHDECAHCGDPLDRDWCRMPDDKSNKKVFWCKQCSDAYEESDEDQEEEKEKGEEEEALADGDYTSDSDSDDWWAEQAWLEEREAMREAMKE